MPAGASETKRKIAIACQGGGAHTAFTAGALTTILDRYLRGGMSGIEIVGFSGTSGGAICATLAWSALLARTPEERSERAGRLRGFWLNSFPDGNAATLPFDQMMNMALVGMADLPLKVSQSPFAVEAFLNHVPGLRGSPAERWLDARAALMGLLEDYVPFGEAADEYADWRSSDWARPELYVGAAGVLSGAFKAFEGGEDVFGPECVVASACLPDLMTAQRVPGIDDDVYWDGLFSQNPPVTPFVKRRVGVGPIGSGGVHDPRPDEIWIIRINPRERRAGPGEAPLDAAPISIKDIADRRNEMAGNISLEQEKGCINRINEMVRCVLAAQAAAPDPAAFAGMPGIRDLLDYKIVEIEDGIEMDPIKYKTLGHATKLDRTRPFLKELFDHGAERAGAFLSTRLDGFGGRSAA